MSGTLTWPVAAIVIAIVLATTALGITHVITAQWIERTFTALLGVLFGGGVGYAVGVFRARPGGGVEIERAARAAKAKESGE